MLLNIFSIVYFRYSNLALEAIISSNSKCLHKIMMIDKFSDLMVSVIIFIFIRFLKY